MKTIYIMVLLIAVALGARENPFAPVENVKSEGVATNKKSPIKDFESKSITLPDSARILKTITVSYQNLDGTIETITSDVEKKVDWHYPLVLSQQHDTIPKEAQAKQTNETKIIKMSEFFSLELSKNKIRLISNEKLKRDFMVSNPFKIVLDFESKRDFATVKKQVGFENFDTIVLGNHEGYYRVVIELDGQYTYKLDNGIIYLY